MEKSSQEVNCTLYILKNSPDRRGPVAFADSRFQSSRGVTSQDISINAAGASETSGNIWRASRVGRKEALEERKDERRESRS